MAEAARFFFFKVKYYSKGREGVLQDDGHATIKAEDFFFLC